ncbi:hypothetical protein [Maricaulis sp.]|uniref:hypothetical protein n=1 Tax=Maricaulis sp. TaxID=1486257 RepID=UPI002628A295|nr:hypothetical protein [Maricaulis sp.]
MAKKGLLSRRSFLTRVGGTSLALGAGGAVTGCATTGYTDSDPYDPAGAGRGSSGVTDSDSGAYADPVGRGRGGRGGVTDSDSGAYADPVGRGRGGSGVTDSDRGA